MTLYKSNTQWVFLCAIFHEKKDKTRHLKDLSFAVFSLLSKNIPKENIQIIIDTQHTCSDHFVNEILTKFKIGSVTDFYNAISGIDKEHLVLTVIGHGDENGIGTEFPLKPYPLLNAINTNNNILTASIILGQCYAGVFNYLDTLKKEKSAHKKEYSSISIIGASHLNSSLSGKIEIGIGEENIIWTANIFLFNFYYWILMPVDIDGDSRCALIDAFKYAGSRTSKKLIEMKRKMFFIINEMNIDLAKLVEEIDELDRRLKLKDKNGDDTLFTIVDERDLKQKKMQHQSMKDLYDTYIDLSYINQDPWILNESAAREIEFFVSRY